MKRLILGLALAGVLGLLVVGSAAADVTFKCSSPCTITVSISNQFPESEKQIIREVMADFSQAPGLDLVEGGGGKIRMVVGGDGFWTSWNIAGGDIKWARIEITPGWFGWCCDEHDGIRGVYCHELMHAIGLTGHDARTEPSCFNGTSPYLGVEDFAWIAAAYP